VGAAERDPTLPLAPPQQRQRGSCGSRGGARGQTLAVGVFLSTCLALGGATPPARAESLAPRHAPDPGQPAHPPSHTAAEALAPINWFGCGADTVAHRGPPLALALLNFALLLWLVVRLGRRPLRIFLDTRRRELEEQIAEASHLRAQAEQQLAAAQQQLERVEGEIAELLAAAARDAEHERDHLLSQAAAEAQRIVASAERTLRQEVDRIRRQLEVGAIGAALEAAERLLQQRVTADDRRRLQEECLAQLGQPSSGAGL